MKKIRLISIVEQDGASAIVVTYNEIDENGNVIEKNAKAPVFYAVGDVADAVDKIKEVAYARIGE